MSERDYHTDNKAFMIYKDWKAAFNQLTNAQAGELTKALFAFACDGELPPLETPVNLLFTLFSQQIDRDGKKWEEICKRRSEYGKQKAAKVSKRQQKVAKEADTDTDTETGTEKDTEKEKDTDIERISASPKKPAPVRHKYGEYKNVLLSDEEADKLREELQGQFESYIEKLSAYIASTGKSYKSHYATIRRWVNRDREQQQANKPAERDTRSFFEIMGDQNND